MAEAARELVSCLNKLARSLSRKIGHTRFRAAVMYGAMVFGAIILFLLIDACGRTLVAPEPVATAAQDAAVVAGKPDALLHVLVALTAVLVTGRLLSPLFRYLGQPPVIGEVVGGILLGPSLLGQFWPEAAACILPWSVAPYLGIIAQLAVILYMFLGMTQQRAALIFVALLLSALATEAIGVHAIFGAFLLGAVIPHDSMIAETFTRKLEDLVTVLLLPAFFALTGMRTRIGLVSGVEQWLMCGLIILVATAGKFGGTLVSARLTGLGWRDAASLGLLMNTRGLMELIALNIGLDMRIISPPLFAMMVLMALVTTIATTPLLQLLTPRSLQPEQSDRLRQLE